MACHLNCKVNFVNVPVIIIILLNLPTISIIKPQIFIFQDTFNLGCQTEELVKPSGQIEIISRWDLFTVITKPYLNILNIFGP